MESVYSQVMAFKKKYPGTVTHHRLRKHANIIEMHLNPGEVVLYAFAGRIMIGQKRVLFGYFLNSITPDLYNDLQVRSGIIWGGVTIDTVKEVIELSNISKSALPEIETQITSYMMEAKKKYKEKGDFN